MRSVVTGCAGFIGSHLAEALIERGHTVIGVDCFLDYYARNIKERNLKNLMEHNRFSLVRANLVNLDLKKLFTGSDYIFHLAAQAGVRASWGRNFDIYTENNILATQHVLEAARDLGIKKLIYASSSSIYGDAESYPTPEDAPPRPISPYGLSKLAGEKLVDLYHKGFGVPAVSLRYFTVFGPRQRPDMAFAKFIKAALNDEPIEVYGDGTQTRDFTFISDIVKANIAAAEGEVTGEIFNIGGGCPAVLNEVIDIISQISERELKVNYRETQKGDARHTSADITKAKELLGYEPEAALVDGLKRQYEWLGETNNLLEEVAK